MTTFTSTSCLPDELHHFTHSPTPSLPAADHPASDPLEASAAVKSDFETVANVLYASDISGFPLIDLLPMGVLLVSQQIELVYLNRQAQNLCQQIADTSLPPQQLPPILEQVCHHLLQHPALKTPLIAEYRASEHLHLRIQAQSIHLPPQAPAAHPWDHHLLLLLENCWETLQKELWIEQQKYDLTERESEIWSLLRQNYSYREIANLLQISLNTVKTHVKNVYAKKRSHQGREKLLIF